MLEEDEPDLYATATLAVQPTDVALSYTPDDENCSKVQHRWDHIRKNIEDEGINLADRVIPNGMDRRQANRGRGESTHQKTIKLKLIIRPPTSEKAGIGLIDVANHLIPKIVRTIPMSM